MNSPELTEAIQQLLAGKVNVVELLVDGEEVNVTIGPHHQTPQWVEMNGSGPPRRYDLKKGRERAAHLPEITRRILFIIDDLTQQQSPPDQQIWDLLPADQAIVNKFIDDTLIQLPTRDIIMCWGEAGTGKSAFAARLAEHYLTNNQPIRLVLSEGQTGWALRLTTAPLTQQQLTLITIGDRKDEQAELVIIDSITDWITDHGLDENDATHIKQAFDLILQQWPNAEILIIAHPNKSEQRSIRGSGKLAQWPRLILHIKRHQILTQKWNLGPPRPPLNFQLGEPHGRLTITGQAPTSEELKADQAQAIQHFIHHHPLTAHLSRRQLADYLTEHQITIPNAKNGHPLTARTAAELIDKNRPK